MFSTHIWMSVINQRQACHSQVILRPSPCWAKNRPHHCSFLAHEKQVPWLCLDTITWQWWLHLFYFLRQGLFVQSWLSQNSLCRPGWSRTHRSAYLCLPNAGIKGMHHHHHPAILYLKTDGSEEKQGQILHSTCLFYQFLSGLLDTFSPSLRRSL